MAKLEYLHHWAKYVPDIGNNRELEKPFYLEVATGLSFERLERAKKELKELADLGLSPKDFAARTAAIFDGMVRMGAEPLEVGGTPVPGLAEYLEMVVAHAGVGYLEVMKTVYRFNSVGEADRLFSERHSGGTASTPVQSAAKAGAPKEGP